MEKFKTVTVDGVTYKLRFSINAMIAFEQVTGKKVSDLGDILQDMGKRDVDVVLLRNLFHGVLHDYHPEITLDEAGLMMSDIGIMEAAELVVQVMFLAFPEAKKGVARGKPRRATPRKPKSDGATS